MILKDQSCQHQLQPFLTQHEVCLKNTLASFSSLFILEIPAYLSPVSYISNKQ